MLTTRLNTTLVDIPFVRPIKTAIHDLRSAGCVLVELETDQGITGQSIVCTLNGERLKILEEMIKSFAHRIEGKDPHFSAGIWQECWKEMNPIGHKGFSVAALSAIDTACWDIVGKAADLPLHKMFGACRSRVATYASGGLWLSQSIEECVSECEDFINQGFRSMKIRVGHEKIADDVERVRLIRESVGDDIGLLVDANQAFSAKHAIRLGRELEQYNLIWFEEPVPYHHLAAQTEVRTTLSIPIASGETEYSRYGMRDAIDAGAVDILMPDLQRIGGLTEFRRTAALAASFNIPISSHLFTEYSLCIAASEPGCLCVEHMPWFSLLFNEELVINDGYIHVPDRPGTGFTFNQEAIERFKLT